MFVLPVEVHLYSPLICIFCGVSSLVAVRKHFLNALLSLEFIMLNIYWLLSQYVDLGGSYLLLFFLTIVACEGALGLAVLVSIVRTHGNDNFNSFNVLMC